MQKPVLTALLLFVVVFNIVSQPGSPTVYTSPEYHSDGKVSFRLLAPFAKEVKLNAQFEKFPLPMTKNENGIWSLTRGPVKPDIYPYSFNVDGITVADPKNALLFPNEGLPSSLVEINDTRPLVPYGAKCTSWYCRI